MSDKKPGFLRVGVDEESLPKGLGDTHSPNSEKSTWWPSKKTMGPTAIEDNSTWRSTASDEIENFKRVPVVGNLPWRIQYMVVTFIFMLSIISLLYFSSRNNIESSPIPDTIYFVDSSFDDLLTGEDLPENFSQQISQSLNINNPADWAELSPLIKTIPDYQTDAKTVVSSANKVSQILSQSISNLNPHWRAAGEQGEWASVDAVNFAQMLVDLQFLQETSLDISKGMPIPERFARSRQNIEQAFRVFASSDTSRVNSNLTQAWRVAAAGFLNSRQDLDIIIGRQEQWNNLVSINEIFDAKKMTILSKINTNSSSSSKTLASYISGAIAILSLIVLIWIGWKQQQWHLLAAKASGERLQLGINQLVKQLRFASHGDLSTKVRPTNEFLNPLASALNNTVKNLRQLVIEIKNTASNTNNAASNATETSGALIEDTRMHMANLTKNGEDILSISSAIKEISELSEVAEDMAKETISSASVGKSSVLDISKRIQSIKDKSEEGLSRSKKLSQSSSEIVQAATILNEVSEQISVLAIQATIQAAKAGPAGQGFRVVANGLKELSEKSGAGAAKISILLESTIHDIKSMEEAMRHVAKETDEGSKLGDLSYEMVETINSSLSNLNKMINKIKILSCKQDSIAATLSERTSESLSEIQETLKNAQLAADSVASLLVASQQLENSASKFKV